MREHVFSVCRIRYTLQLLLMAQRYPQWTWDLTENSDAGGMDVPSATEKKKYQVHSEHWFYIVLKKNIKGTNKNIMLESIAQEATGAGNFVKRLRDWGTLRLREWEPRELRTEILIHWAMEVLRDWGYERVRDGETEILRVWESKGRREWEIEGMRE